MADLKSLLAAFAAAVPADVSAAPSGAAAFPAASAARAGDAPAGPDGAAVFPPAPCDTLSAAQIETLAARYPWFAPARVLRERMSGVHDPQLAVLAPWRAESSLRAAESDVAALTAVLPDDVIDRFLREDDLRIVAGEGGPEGEVVTEALLDDEDELVSEELAEIYLAQGLHDKAAAIYRKLSLLNPEKSVYFAELIGKMGNNN